MAPMARLRTISRWLVLALVVAVAVLILLHQLLAGGQAPSHAPAPLPTALAPRQFIARAQPMDARAIALHATIRS
jgi:uncharacterized MAPEG superfamily protein